MPMRYIKHYGEEHQRDKLEEETVELLQRLKEYKQGKCTLKELQDEMGDVLNLLEQFDCFYEGALFCVKTKKRARQDLRIKKGL